MIERRIYHRYHWSFIGNVWCIWQICILSWRGYCALVRHCIALLSVLNSHHFSCVYLIKIFCSDKTFILWASFKKTDPVLVCACLHCQGRAVHVKLNIMFEYTGLWMTFARMISTYRLINIRQDVSSVLELDIFFCDTMVQRWEF